MHGMSGYLEIDNNGGEHSIKPFVIGCKNWLFCNTSSGPMPVLWFTLCYSPPKLTNFPWTNVICVGNITSLHNWWWTQIALAT